MKLAGKKTIVTGANRSIGQAIALAFAKEGADVVISYRSDKEGAESTINEIEKMGRKGKAIFADFSQQGGVQEFFKSAVDFLKSIDILVNNAAIWDTTEFFAMKEENFEHLLRVNVAVPLFLSQMVAQHMIEKKIAGSIINISSITGVRPYPGRTCFATSKAALNMMTQNMALDLAKYQIRVNAIAPGSTPYEFSDERVEEIPLGRFGKPEDHAHAAVYLASEESSWKTGQILSWMVDILFLFNKESYACIRSSS